MDEEAAALRKLEEAQVDSLPLCTYVSQSIDAPFASEQRKKKNQETPLSSSAPKLALTMRCHTAGIDE